MNDLRDVLYTVRQGIDRAISSRTLAAIRNNHRVTEAYIINRLERLFGTDREYFFDGQVIYVIKREVGNHPVLMTVLTPELIDNLLLRASFKAGKQDVKDLLNNWKRDARYRKNL